MKTLIYFNLPDKPENMGQSQSTEDLTGFLNERKDILKDAVVTADRLTFTKSIDENGNPVLGFAIITEVPIDFQN